MDRPPRVRSADADAFVARILLIHHYRRVVLRDPLAADGPVAAGLAGQGGAGNSVAISIADCLPRRNNGLIGNASNETGAAAKGRRGRLWHAGSASG